jgi:hypothetical protein
MNTNCLRGVRCPKATCGSEGPFQIEGTAMFEVHDDGTESFGDVDWDDDSQVTCTACGHSAPMLAFTALTDDEQFHFVREVMAACSQDEKFLYQVAEQYVEGQDRVQYLDFCGEQTEEKP